MSSGSRIAILGWGSLVHDPRELAFDRTQGWQFGGPILPLEFSRRSSDGRLTLVIDDKDGVACSTRFAVSSLPSIEAAIANLALREGPPGKPTPEGNIGFVAADSGKGRSRLPRTLTSVGKWATSNGFTHAIWTDLPPSADYSPQWAIEYLGSLTEPTLTKARMYFLDAPPEVETKLRFALRQRGWLNVNS